MVKVSNVARLVFTTVESAEETGKAGFPDDAAAVDVGLVDECTVASDEISDPVEDDSTAYRRRKRASKVILKIVKL